MKIRILIIFLLLAGTLSIIEAQEKEVVYKGKFNIGAEGGIQFTNLDSFARNYSTQSKTGFYVGVFGEYNLSQTVKIKLGLQYDRRGFELDSYTLFAADSGVSSGNSYYYYQVEYNLAYITIPLHIKYARGSKKFKISLEGGIYYSIYLNANHNGIERYYFDSKDYFDHTGTIFNNGFNDYLLDGPTDGIRTVNRYSNDGEQNEVTYDEYLFNSFDFGFDFLIGIIYQPTPSIGITISPGFTYSFTKAFENPTYESKWAQITKINIGFIYTLNLTDKVFGEK